MSKNSIYNEESRKLQDKFDSRKLADRLSDTIIRDRFRDEDRKFIEAQNMFFLATTDKDGNPDCSFKGGAPGFVRILTDNILVFPSYDGNGMFKSMGNIRAHPAVGLLFINFEHPRRLRVNGIASVSSEDEMLSHYPGAQLIVQVEAKNIFPNCPRYIPTLETKELSPFVPNNEGESPIPEWKTRQEFNDALPKSDPAKKST